MTIYLAVLTAVSVMAVGQAPPGTDAFLARYVQCAHTMATADDINNCEAFDAAMNAALVAAEAEVQRRAEVRDRQRTLTSLDSRTLVVRLADEQAAWEHYTDVACDYYTERDLWGTDGQRIQAPICGMQLDTYRLRTLQALIKNLY